MRQYPWQITLLTLVLVAIGAFAGVSMLIASASTDPGAAVDGRPLPFLLGQLGARNLTMAGVLLAAWLVGGPRVLGFVLAMRAATESLDLYYVVSSGALPINPLLVVVAFVGLFIVPEILSARYLLRRVSGAVANAAQAPTAASTTSDAVNSV